MRVTVCIGSVKTTSIAHTLRSLATQTSTDFEVILVGQGDDPELQQFGSLVGETYDRVRYIHLQTCGTSGARNAAVAASTTEIVAFIDDDCIASPNWIETILDLFSADETLRVVGGSVLCPPVTSRLCACPQITPSETIYEPVPGQPQVPEGFEWIGCNFAAVRDSFVQVGGFDPVLGPGTEFPSGEDTDLLLRFERVGTRMMSTPRLEVVHEYGVRCGVRTRFRHSRNYARGNGGVAGKLTLSQDPRGLEWLQQTKSQIPSKLAKGRLPAAAAAAYRYWHFRSAYRSCVHDYRMRAGSASLEQRVGRRD